jgi:hypothetical protein
MPPIDYIQLVEMLIIYFLVITGLVDFFLCFLKYSSILSIRLPTNNVYLSKYSNSSVFEYICKLRTLFQDIRLQINRILVITEYFFEIFVSILVRSDFQTDFLDELRQIQHK